MKTNRLEDIKRRWEDKSKDITWLVERAEGLVEALERVDKRCLKYRIIPKMKICLDIIGGFPRCHGCNAVEALAELKVEK